MARESRTKYAILGLLSMGPKCGYEIKKAMEKSTMFFWNESYGQIYPMLKNLVTSRLATLEVVERDDQPDMKVYTITDTGRQELTRWLRQPAEPHPVRNEMLLKLFFGANISPDITLAHLERTRASLHEQREAFEADKLQLREAHAGDENLDFWMLTLQYGELMNEAMLRWCDLACEKVDSRRDA